MASGTTGTAQLTNVFRPMLAEAKNTIEQVPVMTKVVDKVSIPAGQGGVYRLPTWGVLPDAVDLVESQDIANANKLSDSLETYTPTEVGHMVVVSERVQKTVGPKVLAQAGRQMGDAVARRIDKDGLLMLDGFSLALGTAGTALTWEHIGAARTAIRGGGGGAAALVEPCPQDGDVFGVFHPHHLWNLLKDFSPAGTYPITPGLTETTQLTGQVPSRVSGVKLFEAGNLSIDSSDDAKGGVFHRQALLCVMDEMPSMKEEDSARSRGTLLVQTVWYIFGEHKDAWGREMLFDAVMPVS